MTTVFLSGSRKLSRLAVELRQRLQNIIDSELDVVIGDANGADKAMQSYFAEQSYTNVLVFFVGHAPRNNVGRWATKHIVDHKRLTGRAFYALKDKAMSDVADYGLVLWDGKSPGSVQNMLWLSERGKKIVVYKAPDRKFANLASYEELLGFLANSDGAVLAEIADKVRLPDQLTSRRKQPSLNF